MLMIKQIRSVIRVNGTNSRFFGGWVYKDNTEGYHNDDIEQELKALQGGSVDLNTCDNTGIGFIKINNPSKRNALTGKMIYDLRVAVESLLQWTEGKAVILHGTSHSFCSGSDISSVRAFSSSEEGENMCMYMQNTLTLLQRLPLITVAYVEGKALGGGAELVTACDFRLMTEDAEIGFVHKKMGLIPGWGGVTRLVRLVGMQKALMLLGSAHYVEAHHAMQLGLADHVLLLKPKDIFHEIHIRAHPDESEHDPYLPDCTVHHAVDWLENTFDLQNTDVSVIRAIKSSVVQCSEATSFNSSLKQEKDTFKSLWGAEANRNALSASRHGK